MNRKLNKNSIFYLWAAFDCFYILRFIWINLSQDRIPLIDDVDAFSHIYAVQGAYTLILFSLSLLLNISIIFSAILLAIKWRHVHKLIYGQSILRLLFIVPSISVLPWVLKNVSITDGTLFLIMTIVSEILKVSSIYLAVKSTSKTA